MYKAIETNLSVKSRDLSVKAFRLLVFVIWTQYTVLNFVVQIIKRLPLIGSLYEYVIPTAIIGLALLSLPYMLRKVRYTDVFFYIFCLIFILGSLAWNEKNSTYIQQDLWRMLGAALPMLFVGVSYSHEESKTDLFWASLFSVAAVFLYQLYSLSLGRELNEDNMDSAYKVLPSAMYLIYWALERRKPWHWIVAAAAMVMMFIFGTRGPVVAEIAFLAVGLFLNVLNRKSTLTKLVWLSVFAAVLVVVCSGDNLINAATFLSEKFEDIGFSTRVLDRFIKGEISEGSGRDFLYAKIKTAISEKPILGYGLMGDRPIIGSYVHNLFLEIWCHFGVIFGTAILIGMLGVPTVALLRSRKTNMFNFVLMLICAVFVKLMLTGSYTVEANLFLLLGLSLGVLRSRKIES